MRCCKQWFFFAKESHHPDFQFSLWSIKHSWNYIIIHIPTVIISVLHFFSSHWILNSVNFNYILVHHKRIKKNKIKNNYNNWSIKGRVWKKFQLFVVSNYFTRKSVKKTSQYIVIIILAYIPYRGILSLSFNSQAISIHRMEGLS